MSETLLIHYNIEQAQQATWALCNDAGELTGKINTGTIAELSEISGKYRAIVLLNSQCLHINQLQLPTSNQQKMLKAIPFAIEEFIAEDIENFHFVISKNKHSKHTAVVGIDKITLQNILQIFQQANITIEKIIPDVLCLAADEQQWVCLNYLDTTYLQTDRLNGMVLSHDVLPYIINSKLQEKARSALLQTLPEKILLFTEQENTAAFEQLTLDDLGENQQSENNSNESHNRENHEPEKINIVYNKHPLVVFCGHYKQALALNLLQHEFKNKSKSSGLWLHWRLAASLATIWLVLSLALSNFQYAQIKKTNNITKAEIEKIYKQAFPKSRKIINPRVQMEQKLKELKSGAGNSNNGLIFLLAESFGTLRSDTKNITLQSLTFRNNRMNISLESNNLQSIENLNKNLNNNNKIQSEITSSSSEKNKVKGNLRIEGRS
jgi:general secretion pathway protein L